MIYFYFKMLCISNAFWNIIGETKSKTLLYFNQKYQNRKKRTKHCRSYDRLKILEMHLSIMKEASIHATPFLENQPSNVIPLPPSPPKQKSILSYIQVCYQYVQQRKGKKDTSDIDNYRHGACNMSCTICYFQTGIYIFEIIILFLKQKLSAYDLFIAACQHMQIHPYIYTR